MSLLDTLPYESIDLEAKRAGGRDGRGALPKDIWETYSSFANTAGGIILLGVSEREDRSLYITGIENTDKVLDDFWNTLNNPSKVNLNIISKKDVEIISEDNKNVIKITIPRATRKQQPIYINNNPLTGTYIRKHTGDYHCTEAQVRQMLAEQTQDSRDVIIQKGFTLDDLHLDTLKAYRNRLAVVKPDHPYNNDDNQEFLRKIGAWRQDRETGEQGLTLAGLLMFGKSERISEALPYYLLDYRHLPHEHAKTEWLDRLIPDGTWSGNVYDFYRAVIAKLTEDVKVPFELVGDVRNDDTPIHKALREALVNALVHADYSQEKHLLVIKAPDYFGFINPGCMRVPVLDALAGGSSDCRNHTLQTMFSLINLGEKAGSGIPRIIENWDSQNYRFPQLWEDSDKQITGLVLRAISLLPDTTLAKLQAQFGLLYPQLTDKEVLTLAVADIEGMVSNQRMQAMVSVHPTDLTKLLSGLVDKGCLLSNGFGRGTSYCLVGNESIDLTSSLNKDASLCDNDVSLCDNDVSLCDNDVSLCDKEAQWLEITTAIHEKLLNIAKPVSEKKRASTDLIQQTITNMCELHFLTAQQIAAYLHRTTNDIQRRYIKPMIDNGQLQRRFPHVPNHEKQAYRTVKNTDKDMPEENNL